MQARTGVSPMVDAELEIGLHRRFADGYSVELRLSQPDSEALDQPTGPGLVRFDPRAFDDLLHDDEAYGRRLGELLFGDPTVAECFHLARGYEPLRVRLAIGPTARELHDLHWEKVRLPGDGALLVAGERLYFSRFLSSVDWRRVRPRPKGELTALVVVADPTGNVGGAEGQWSLPKIDAAAERARATASLAPIPVLASEGRATLENLIGQISRHRPDILYLVCHGDRERMNGRPVGPPFVFLEDETGNAKPVTASKIAEQFRQLGQLPRLVVLASCQSAGTGGPSTSTARDNGALSALGPRLAEVGVPAVLAMQGNVSLDSVQLFMPVFFEELSNHGRLDKALGIARNQLQIHDRPDRWMPVLFMRLRTGRLWYEPGFRNNQGQPVFDQWDAVVNNIAEGTCTVILGSGMLESLSGSRHDLARRLAEQHHFPLAQEDQEHLPLVAQYLATMQDDSFLRSSLRTAVRNEVVARSVTVVPEELTSAPVEHLIDWAGARLWERDKLTPYTLLAALRLSVYLTTNPDNLLAAALASAGVTPRVEALDWRPNVRWMSPTPPSGQPDDDFYEPSSARPLVFHFFGHLRDPNTLVLTEDHYFDYLIRVGSLQAATTGGSPGAERVRIVPAPAGALQPSPVRFRDRVPFPVAQALSDRALVFLGFRIDDWDFRALFRLIVGQEGAGGLGRYAHVAVQLDPEENRILDVARARRYLERYFRLAGIGANVNVYWGSVEDFAKNLHQAWLDENRPDPLARIAPPTSPPAGQPVSEPGAAP